MALEGVLQTGYPAYVEVPREVEEKAFVWAEFARGDDRVLEGGETNKFVGGKMFLVKLGPHRRDPIGRSTFLRPRPRMRRSVSGRFGRSDDWVPGPVLPTVLQKAHVYAALVDFDVDIVQDLTYQSIRASLGDQAPILDVVQLQDADPASRRNG